MSKKNVIKIIRWLFIIYSVALFFILFLYGGRTGNQFNLKVFSKEHFEMVNVIPFKTISSFFEKMSSNAINTNIVVINLLANTLMFIPMGMALPVLFEKKFNKLWKVIIFVAMLVLGIEIIQFLTFFGSADIDDLILNVLGAILGYGMINIRTLRRILKIEE